MGARKPKADTEPKARPGAGPVPDRVPAAGKRAPAKRAKPPVESVDDSTVTSNLEAYRLKRDPGSTPEPFGGESAAAPGQRHAGRLTFLVHKHAATHLHYDLRLELDGTLKSWAVPKGPSTHVEEKRLAVHVEDHPLEYGSFEGTIPAGNYGAGSVIIWDRGWYRSFKPEPLLEQYQRGKLELELFGTKLRGRWTLVRMGNKDKEWLLLKKAGAGASDVELVDRYPQSVVTGVTVEEMADLPGHVAKVRTRVEALGAPVAAIDVKKLSPMLATLETEPFDRDGWIFEIKYDGVRVIAERAGARVTLFARSGTDVTGRYPEVVEALKGLPYDAFVLDGEIVAPDATGQPSFQQLQHRMHLVNQHDIARARAASPVVAMFFDCVSLFGHDLRRLALTDRKDCLRAILPTLGTVRYGDHVAKHGLKFFAAADAMRLEGIVAKRAASPYVSARSRDWIKLKCQRRQEFVIGGWTDPQGSRGRFGALHVGVYETAPVRQLVYVTAVGTGFDARGIEALWQRLEPLARDASPFARRSPKGKGHHWVEPRLVCEVRYTEWTHEGGLRHPTFMGLRDDRKPEDVVREDAAVADPTSGAGSTDATYDGDADTAVPAPKVRERPAHTERVPITNPKKVFWPADGYTKSDLIGYYEAIAPRILTYLRDRPVFLTRYPDGITGKSFYQKDAPVFTPDWVHTEMVPSSDGSVSNRFFIVNDTDTLRYLANLGTIPIHMWSSRLGAIDRPDWSILDLDPKGAPFADVIEVARTLKGILDELEIPGHPKTSGASGLHILIPLGARYSYEHSRAFAKLIATLVVQRLPKISTIVRHIQGRGGKVYVDFGQNGHGQSIVSPFCVRALPGATVSCPLLWDEVAPGLVPARFNIRTVLERFAGMDDPLTAVLGEGIRMDEALKRLAARAAE